MTLLSFAAATANSYRSKMILALAVALVLFSVGVYFLVPWIKKQVAEKQLGTPQCSNDDECPDKTVCNHSGLCVPDIIVPRVATDDVMGRGRDGEGPDVYRVAQVKK